MNFVNWLRSSIDWYQRVLSPDHSPSRAFFPIGYCRFSPTCSDYAKEALEKRGFFTGGRLALSRVLRCHPWARGGIDEVPSDQISRQSQVTSHKFRIGEANDRLVTRGL